ncbi:MAG: hypothetical protein QHH02_02595 [Syntrophomonadaceae bacterium]|nr:hypothetical protein [Syntrophomonadaceae bacterium]
MNSLQRTVLKVFLSATLLILVLDRLFPGASPVNLLKYATIIGLFLVASAARKRHREQLLMNRALFWVVVADFFLVYCQTIPGVAGKTVPFGVAGFLLAYLNLLQLTSRTSSSVRESWEHQSWCLALLFR